MAKISFKNTFTGLLALSLLSAGSWACVSGGGGEGAPGAIGELGSKTGSGPGAFNPGNFAAPEDETSTTAAQLVPMPDVSVGASTDIVVDPDDPIYHFRVTGNVTGVCTTSTDPVALKSQKRNLLLAMGPKILQAFEGCAYAAQYDSSATYNHLSPLTPSPPILVKVTIQGQLQYNVNGGEFKNWAPDNFQGNRFLRVWDKFNNYVDTQIKEGGKVELNFTLRIPNGLTEVKFNDAMSFLHFFKIPKAFVPPYPEQQKACNPIQLSCYHHQTGELHYADIGALVSSDPNDGADADFSNVLACVE